MRYLPLAVTTFLLGALPLMAAAPDATGVWRTEATQDGTLDVRISACGAALCGTILLARDPSGTEQPYPHAGRQMIWDMVADGAGQWSGGKIWDPRNDRTFNARMELTGGTLAVSGCVLGICQAQVWQRAD